MKMENGGTALMAAAQKNHPECVKLLLVKEGGIKNNYGCTALMAAAANGNTDCTHLLLNKEARIQNNISWTALMFAVQKNHLECVRLLLDKEKDMKTTNKVRWENDNQAYPPGLTALDIAKIKGYKHIVSILNV